MILLATITILGVAYTIIEITYNFINDITIPWTLKGAVHLVRQPLL